MNLNLEQSMRAVDGSEPGTHKEFFSTMRDQIQKWFTRPDGGQLSREMFLRQDERLRERVRIARELHDTLFQGFFCASMHLHKAVDQVPADSPSKATLSRALRLMHQALDEGRDTLHGLRSSAYVSEPLEEAFAKLGNDLSPSAAPFRVFVTGQAKGVGPGIREQLYLIGREALANALRHSKASIIEVEVEYLPRMLRLAVRDNGCGMDAKPSQADRDSHWGLQGMQERADCIGAQFRIRSRLGAGTEVEICVPQRVLARSRA